MEPAWAWRVLGLPPGSAPADVRRAFRLAAQLLHPDRVADLTDDVRAEAHRRMVELAEAYRVCAAVAAGAPPPPPRAHREPGSTSGAHGAGLAAAGGRAAELLERARAELARVAPWAAFRNNGRTVLDRDANAAVSRAVVTLLEQVADAWPGTLEGDTARVLLVTSVAAANTLSARERAGHLVLVVDPEARDTAWDSLRGRDELAVAQVVYAHPTVVDELRGRARQRLAEYGDWATLADDRDTDVRDTARAHLLVQQGERLAERERWLERGELAAFDRDLAAWRAAVGAAPDRLPPRLRDRLRDLSASVGQSRARV